MTKSLEETFNLPPIKEVIKVEKVEVEKIEINPIANGSETDETTQIIKALTVAEKIDHALTKVDDLDNNDSEMDDIAKEALNAYVELKDLAMNMSDAHSGRMMEVAASMLKTSLDAKEAKINRKLKTIDLQLKKMRMDRLAGIGGRDSEDDNGVEFDRNELLKHLHIVKEE
jgi:hypothetical protein